MLAKELKLTDKENVLDSIINNLETRGIIFSYNDLFIIPRERLIEKQFQDRIESINKGAIHYFVPTRTVFSFKEDFLNFISILETAYERRFGEVGRTEFFQSYLPRMMLIYGDDILGIRKKIRIILDKLSGEIRRSENGLDELVSIWQGPIMTPEEIKKLRLFQYQAPEVFKNIVERIIYSLVNNEFNDNVIGFLIFGSWARLKPNPNSDLDIRIITKTKFINEEKEFKTIKSKLEKALNGLPINGINSYHAFSLDEKIRVPDLEDEASPLFGRFGILNGTEYLIIAKSKDLLRAILDKVEELSSY
jgi:predicted nucleotidyltransferase